MNACLVELNKMRQVERRKNIIMIAKQMNRGLGGTPCLCWYQSCLFSNQTETKEKKKIWVKEYSRWGKTFVRELLYDDRIL